MQWDGNTVWGVAADFLWLVRFTTCRCGRHGWVMTQNPSVGRFPGAPAAPPGSSPYKPTPSCCPTPWPFPLPTILASRAGRTSGIVSRSRSLSPVRAPCATRAAPTPRSTRLRDNRLPDRVAGRIDLPAATPPDIRVRVRRFLAVPKDGAALFLCHAGSRPGSTVRFQRQPASSHGRAACQVQPFPVCEFIRCLRCRLVTPGTMASADSCAPRRSSQTTAPSVAGVPGAQVSLSKERELSLSNRAIYLRN